MNLAVIELIDVDIAPLDFWAFRDATVECTGGGSHIGGEWWLVSACARAWTAMVIRRAVEEVARMPRPNLCVIEV